jgi:hypothetical protein
VLCLLPATRPERTRAPVVGSTTTTYTVVITLWDPETAAHRSQDPLAYAQGLAKSLIPSGAFRTSRFQNNPQATDGDIVATSTGNYCNSAVIPIFTILSLHHPDGVRRRVMRRLEHRRLGRASDRSVRVDFRNKTRVVMGLPALIMGILPGWSWGANEGFSLPPAVSP